VYVCLLRESVLIFLPLSHGGGTYPAVPAFVSCPFVTNYSFKRKSACYAFFFWYMTAVGLLCGIDFWWGQGSAAHGRCMG